MRALPPRVLSAVCADEIRFELTARRFGLVCPYCYNDQDTVEHRYDDILENGQHISTQSGIDRV